MKPQVTGILEAPLTTVETFCKNVQITDTCWLYTGDLSHNGYGRFTIKGTNRRAHRIMWELTGHTVDFNKHLDHLCRVKKCVNPAHLEEVTPRINVIRADGPTAVNARKTECIHGHSFLDPKNVKIKYRKSDDGTTVQERRECLACRDEFYKRNNQFVSLAKVVTREVQQVVNNDEPMVWVDPTTGNKLYNQAEVERIIGDIGKNINPQDYWRYDGELRGKIILSDIQRRRANGEEEE